MHNPKLNEVFVRQGRLLELDPVKMAERMLDELEQQYPMTVIPRDAREHCACALGHLFVDYSNATTAILADLIESVATSLPPEEALHLLRTQLAAALNKVRGSVDGGPEDA